MLRAVCFAPESVSSSERNDRIAKIQSQCRKRDAIQSERRPNNATSGQRARTGQRDGRARDGREAKKQGGERDKKPEKENFLMRFSAVPQPDIVQGDKKTIQ